MNWGNRIIMVLVVFIGGMTYMTYTCMKQTDIQLVANDYYEQEIAYQGIINKENNYKALAQKPQLADNLQENKIMVDFSTLENFAAISGKIFFFRPSQSKLDFNVEIEPGKDGIQWIEKEQLNKGKWLVRLDWEDGQKAYYNEQTLYVQ
jgi:hypothetical protein